MYRTRRLFAVGATSLALILVGCGDDDGGSSSGGGDFCDLAEETEKASDELVNAREPEDVEEVYKDFVAKAEAAADKAPDEIKDEMNDSIDAFKRLIDILEDNDWDLEATSSDEDFQELTSDEDFDQTSSDVSEYLSDECGISDDDGSDSTEPSDAPADTEAPDDTDATTGGPTGDITDAQVDAIQQIFPKLSDDQATCLIEKGFDAANAADQSAILDVLDDCNINITDLQP